MNVRFFFLNWIFLSNKFNSKINYFFLFVIYSENWKMFEIFTNFSILNDRFSHKETIVQIS